MSSNVASPDTEELMNAPNDAPEQRAESVEPQRPVDDAIVSSESADVVKSSTNEVAPAMDSPEATSADDAVVEEHKEEKPEAEVPLTPLVLRIVRELEEPKSRVVARAVHKMGEAVAERLLEKALAIEKEGGEMISDGSRRRTPGGVFFRLLIAETSRSDVKWIWEEDRKMRLAAMRARLDGMPLPPSAAKGAKGCTKGFGKGKGMPPFGKGMPPFGKGMPGKGFKGPFPIYGNGFMAFPPDMMKGKGPKGFLPVKGDKGKGGPMDCFVKGAPVKGFPVKGGPLNGKGKGLGFWEEPPRRPPVMLGHHIDYALEKKEADTARYSNLPAGLLKALEAPGRPRPKVEKRAKCPEEPTPAELKQAEADSALTPGTKDAAAETEGVLQRRPTPARAEGQKSFLEALEQAAPPQPRSFNVEEPTVEAPVEPARVVEPQPSAPVLQRSVLLGARAALLRGGAALTKEPPKYYVLGPAPWSDARSAAPAAKVAKAAAAKPVDCKLTPAEAYGRKPRRAARVKPQGVWRKKAAESDDEADAIVGDESPHKIEQQLASAVVVDSTPEAPSAGA